MKRKTDSQDRRWDAGNHGRGGGRERGRDGWRAGVGEEEEIKQMYGMMTSLNGNKIPRYWPYAWGIHRSPVNSPHKGQWRGALMFSLICAWRNDWVNNREAGGLKRHRVHCDVIVMEGNKFNAAFTADNFHNILLAVDAMIEINKVGTNN